MEKAVALIALVLVSFQLLAQNGASHNDPSGNLPAKIDAYLASAARAHKFNGVALVAKNGEVIFHKAYGWKNAAAKTLNGTDTRFPILSITKSFTAMVLLKLQEQGKLSLKDRLGEYLPDYPQGDRIRLEHLLTHSSGIYDYANDIGEEDTALVGRPVTKKQVLDVFINKPLEFRPGEGFSYNSSAYYLAGMVIEKATGKSYEQNVRELILEPLGMGNSGFDFLGLPADSKATGYRFLREKEQKPYPFYHHTVGYAAGAIYSTTADMFKWTQAIARRQLLSPKSWRKAFKPRVNGYGYGFRMGSFGGREYVKHSGGYPGYVSEFVYYPEEEVTIILLKNSSDYGQDVWPVTMGLSSIAFGQPYDLWRPRKEVALAEGVLRQKAGEYARGKQLITFFVEDRQLHLTLPGGGRLSLLAESEDSFYFENFNTHFRFVKDGKGRVERVVIHEHGQDAEWEKVED